MVKEFYWVRTINVFGGEVDFKCESLHEAVKMAIRKKCEFNNNPMIKDIQVIIEHKSLFRSVEEIYSFKN